MACYSCNTLAARPLATTKKADEVDTGGDEGVKHVGLAEIDRHGFVRREGDTSQAAMPDRFVAREKNRKAKWEAMLKSSENKYRIIRSRQFQSRVRKGIPNDLRSQIWLLYLADVDESDLVWADEMLERAPCELENTQSGRDALDAVSKDLARTYPTHVKYQKPEGQAELSIVLCGYALSDQDVGYCQGMSFIAGLFLMYLQPREALCVLRNVMTKPKWSMRNLFKPDMAAVSLRLYQYDALLKKVCPLIHHHFASLGLEPSMYATHWFATIFTYNFSYLVVLRIWDIFLAEGWSIVLGAAVTFWKRHQRTLLSIDRFEIVFDYMKKCTTAFTDAITDSFIADACKVADRYVTPDVLQKLEGDFDKRKG